MSHGATKAGNAYALHGATYYEKDDSQKGLVGVPGRLHWGATSGLEYLCCPCRTRDTTSLLIRPFTRPPARPYGVDVDVIETDARRKAAHLNTVPAGLSGIRGSSTQRLPFTEERAT